MRHEILLKLIVLTVIIFNVISGCQKAETDPCQGLINESPPSQIVVKFIDKQTKEAIIVDTAVVKISEKQSGKPYKNWNVYNRTGLSQLHGSLTLSVFNEIPGTYQYGIQIKDREMVTLSYQITRKETGNLCKPYSYPLDEVKILNQTFDVFQYEGKTYPMILVVTL